MQSPSTEALVAFLCSVVARFSSWEPRIYLLPIFEMALGTLRDCYLIPNSTCHNATSLKTLR
jgi:hypothetical protein